MVTAPASRQPTREDILRALAHVCDPELPALSIVDLGMVGEVSWDDDRVSVQLIPTFTACPAFALIRMQVIAELQRLGFMKIDVVRADEAWSSDRLSPEGRRKLQQLGLAPPPVHGGCWTLQSVARATCPHCGSTDTTMQSLFGSALCRSTHYCQQCRQLFEQFKPL